jgi:hypothetical protein
MLEADRGTVAVVRLSNTDCVVVLAPLPRIAPSPHLNDAINATHDSADAARCRTAGRVRNSDRGTLAVMLAMRCSADVSLRSLHAHGHLNKYFHRFLVILNVPIPGSKTDRVPMSWVSEQLFSCHGGWWEVSLQAAPVLE